MFVIVFRSRGVVLNNSPTPFEIHRFLDIKGQTSSSSQSVLWESLRV